MMKKINQKIKKVIGIDVGTNNLAVSVWENGQLQRYEILENQKEYGVGQKLNSIEKYLKSLFENEVPDAIAAEGTFFMPSQARGYAHVSKAIGVIELAAWDVLGQHVAIIQPSAVKKAVTGNGRAKKDQVADVVTDRFGLPDGLPDHVTDAVAIGYAYLAQNDLLPENLKEVI